MIPGEYVANSCCQGRTLSVRFPEQGYMPDECIIGGDTCQRAIIPIPWRIRWRKGARCPSWCDDEQAPSEYCEVYPMGEPGHSGAHVTARLCRARSSHRR